MAVQIQEVPAKLESMLSIIDTARDGLDRLLKSGVDIDRSLVDTISKLASAHANLSREAMRWLDKLKKSATDSSLDERKRGVVSFIAGLPLGERHQVYKSLAENEATASPSIRLTLD